VDHVLSFREPRRRIDALKTIPNDLPSAYHEVMGRIEQSDKDLALRILGWLFRAQRVLRMDELLEALVVEEGDQDLERESMLDASAVVECCKSLVLYEESSGLVRFTHETVQEFVAKNIPNLLQTSVLAKTCLTYLAFYEFDKPCPEAELLKKRLERYRFLRYAARYWAFHTREAEQCRGVQEAILSCLAGESKTNSILQLEAFTASGGGGILVTSGQTLLHVIAERGLATICSLVLDRSLKTESTGYSQAHVNYILTHRTQNVPGDNLGVASNQLDLAAMDNDGEAALHRAASAGHSDVVEILLRAGADVSTRNPNDGAVALHRAALNGHRKVVETLLRAGADVGAQDHNAKTALHWAAWHGFEDVVESLLAAGADAETQDDDSRTALQWAAFRGYDNIVDILLQRGEDHDGGGTLHWASSKGYAHVVENLLRAGVDVTMQCNDGGTALHRAAAAGNDVVIEILLRNGAAVDLQSNDGGTALHRAAWRGHLSIAKRLLCAGSDARIMNNDGWTALHFSAYAGHYEIAQLLNRHLSSNNENDMGEFSAPIADAVGFLGRLVLSHPTDSILRRALGNEFLRRKLYAEAKLSFDISIRNAMASSGANRITDVEHRGIRCDECALVLRGRHYKCTLCGWDCDICGQCFAAHLHPPEDGIMIPSDLEN
jgi:ankyrin repeat protein